MTSFTEALDPLYGRINFEESLAGLISSPLLQRLRHIRLSNIDSVSMPGISGSTRYEHALGTMHLASRIPMLTKGLSSVDRSTVLAAALLHDSAIPPFGHLVEEAFLLSGLTYDHEQKWRQMMSGEDQGLGGAHDMQMYMGRSPGLIQWCEKTFGKSKAQNVCQNIIEIIQGKGTFGALISSEMDLDNLDNVVRVAFHAGIKCDVHLSERIAGQIVDIKQGRVLFKDGAESLIQSWCDLRTDVYTNLMLAREDFVGKVMLLYAIRSMLECGDLEGQNWNMVDFQLLTTLVEGKDPFASKTVKQWLCGELWEIIDLWWMDGEVPDLKELPSIGKELSTSKHPLYLYRIKDKRYRSVKINLISGKEVVIGKKSNKWLLGVICPSRADLPKNERLKLRDRLNAIFPGGINSIGSIESNPLTLPQPGLLDI